MNSLTTDQQVKLDALLAKLGTLPTQELIVEAIRIRNLDWSIDEGKALYRRAWAGGIAGHKIMSYLLALRDFELFRTTLGEVIHASRLRPQPSGHEDMEEYVRERLIADENSGLQKVVIHFFCSCVMHLHKLLKKAAEGAEYEIPGEDLDVLNAYRGLRNYFEHIENRLPGQVNAAEWVRETITETDWHIEVGLEVDDEGQIVLKGQTFDVTSRGLERIEEVVLKTWNNLTTAALDGVRRYFTANPDNIPGPEEVRQDLLMY